MTDRSRARLLAAVLFAQTLALAGLSWLYDPEAHRSAETWRATAHILGGALDRCHAPHRGETDERTTGGPSDNRA